MLERMNEHEIVKAINSDELDDDNLVDGESWRLICRVRGRNFGLVDAEAWSSLCSRRGYLLHRRNPRGL